MSAFDLDEIELGGRVAYHLTFQRRPWRWRAQILDEMCFEAAQDGLYERVTRNNDSGNKEN